VQLLFDYRPALRARSGVGEYVHELLTALAESPEPGERLHLFTSSWKDRLPPDVLNSLPGVVPHDARVPVRVLNWAWHRRGWPPVERLTGGRFDVVHAAHPLLIPARAAKVVTVHDLDFLDHPERTAAEIRRDYGPLVRSHTHRADCVVAVSQHTRDQVIERLNVPPDRVRIVRAGVPPWARDGRRRPRDPGGPILFVGTVEPRKNLATLLDAYEVLVGDRPDAPPLDVVGRVTEAGRPLVDRARRKPLLGRVRFRGYISESDRRAAYDAASVLVIPSWNEGFGLPALEAMALGVPVVAARRGALVEVLGDAGALVEPNRPDQFADALRLLLDDRAVADDMAARGKARADSFSWARAATAAREVYRLAIERAGQHAHRH
jgi:glycosyltransferase involved in cell wall biosynthesis